MKNVIVTGSTSFIGISLCSALLDKGYKVYAITRLTSSNNKRLPQHQNLQIIYADLNNLTDVLNYKIENIECFFHLGWDGIGVKGRNDINIQKKNIEYTLNSIRIASELNCKCFIQAGSQAEYGHVDGIITEETICNPEIEYGKAKLETYYSGKSLCEKLGMKFLHLRIFSIYGENDHEWTLISTVVRNLIENKDVHLSTCNQYWNFLYIKDAVQEIIGLSEFAITEILFKSEIYNIASDETYLLKKYIDEIHEIIGGTGKLLYGDIDSSKLISIQPKVLKMKNTIGYDKQYSFRMGIISIIKSLK